MRSRGRATLRACVTSRVCVSSRVCVCALVAGFVALATIPVPVFAPAFAQGATLSERVESLEGALEGLRAEGADADGSLALQRRLNTVEAELRRINSRGGTTAAPAPAAVSPELLRRLGAVEAELRVINASGGTTAAPAPAAASPELLRRLGAVEAELRVINASGGTSGGTTAAPAAPSPELLRRLGAVEAELRVINASGGTTAAPPAAASPELLRRLGAVEAELRVINASGGTTAAPPAAASPELLRRLGAVEAELRVINAQEEPTATPLALQRRLGSLEGELREITGSVEGLEFRSRQLEARLAELEAAPPAPTAATAPAGESAGEPAPLLAPEGDGTVRVLGTVPESALGLAAPVAPVAPPPRTAAATPREQYSRALALLRQKNYDEAELEFQLFLDTWPDDALGENAAYWLGETFYVRRRYDEALRIFAASLDDAPAGSKAPDSLLKLGLSLRSLGEAADACAAFQALNDRYADAPESILLRARKELESPDCL